MKRNILTKFELELFQKLPSVPSSATVRVSNVWIIEWLSPNDKPTGRLLHEWMNNQRSGWSNYSMCTTKQEVISAIERATNRAQQSALVPILHLEAHGNEFGLAPSTASNANDAEFLRWDELTEPLQALNVATRCNLMVFVAACNGFAGILALTRGPRAPAVALVGPISTIESDQLFDGTKEFYRRWIHGNTELKEIVASASEQSGTGIIFEYEPFAILAYEFMIERQIISMRQRGQRLRIEKARQRMLAETQFSAAQLQKIWDEMFMIDLYPENRERFGVDMSAIVELIVSG